MNSNTYQYSSSNYQTFYYPSSIDSQQYHGQHFDYSSSTYSIDPYSQTFSNDTYYNPNSIYLDSNTNLTPSPSLQWNSPMNKTVNRNGMDGNSLYSSSRNEYKRVKCSLDFFSSDINIEF